MLTKEEQEEKRKLQDRLKELESKEKINRSKPVNFTFTQRILKRTPAFPETETREENKVTFLFFTRNKNGEIQEHSYELLPASYLNESKLINNGQLTPWSPVTHPIYTPPMLSSLVIYLDGNEKQMEMLELILKEFRHCISESRSIPNDKTIITINTFQRKEYFYLKTINSNNEYIAFTNFQIESSLEDIKLCFWGFSPYTQKLDDIKKEYTAAPF